MRAMRRILAAILLAATVAAVSLAQETWDGVERVVAVGDVHGDLKQFLSVLQSAGVVNEKGDWTGGRTHLVQLGDRVDRGPDSRKVMDLLMRLEGAARRAGGIVHPLLGNHEAMNAYGDLRYVIPAEYEEFRTSESARLRDRYYEEHLESLKETSGGRLPPHINDSYRREWDKKHPLGYFEHRLAWGPGGPYGKWIRRQNAIIRINDSLFVHGGIGPKYAGLTLREINSRIRGELRDAPRNGETMMTDPEGPLWFRGLARESEQQLPHLAAVLKKHAARRIVIAHTTTSGAVLPLYDGRVVMVDVGLSAVYGGPPVCLIIEKGMLEALHRGTRVDLPADAATVPAYLAKLAALEPPGSRLRKALAGAQPDDSDRQP